VCAFHTFFGYRREHHYPGDVGVGLKTTTGRRQVLKKCHDSVSVENVESSPNCDSCISMSDLRRRSITTSGWRVSGDCQLGKTSRSQLNFHSQCHHKSCSSRHHGQPPYRSQALAVWCTLRYIRGKETQGLQYSPQECNPAPRQEDLGPLKYETRRTTKYCKLGKVLYLCSSGYCYNFFSRFIVTVVTFWVWRRTSRRLKILS
jgi:hypothetical protein